MNWKRNGRPTRWEALAMVIVVAMGIIVALLTCNGCAGVPEEDVDALHQQVDRLEAALAQMQERLDAYVDLDADQWVEIQTAQEETRAALLALQRYLARQKPEEVQGP